MRTVKTYNRKDLDITQDFVCPVSFQCVKNGQKWAYRLKFLPDDPKAREEFEAFVKANVGLTGVFKIKVGYDKKMFDNG